MRELREYHVWQRLPPSAQPALFQADYILCMPPGHSLGLRRVASGAFLEDANAPILSFQTVEYEQSDMASLDGLWCVFLLKSNKH